jgi:hypothetical protein
MTKEDMHTSIQEAFYSCYPINLQAGIAMATYKTQYIINGLLPLSLTLAAFLQISIASVCSGIFLKRLALQIYNTFCISKVKTLLKKLIP